MRYTTSVYDKYYQIDVAKRRIKQNRPISLFQFVSLLKEEETDRWKYADFPIWVESHRYDPDKLYPVREWRKMRKLCNIDLQAEKLRLSRLTKDPITSINKG